MSMRIVGQPESSPLSSPEASQSSLRTASSRLKRQRIDSDDEEGAVGSQSQRAGSQNDEDDDFPLSARPSASKRRVPVLFSDDNEEDGVTREHERSVAQEDSQHQLPAGRLQRRASTTSSTYESPAPEKRKLSKASAKMKGKARTEGGPPQKKQKKSSSAMKKKKRVVSGEVSDDFDVSDGVEESDGAGMNVDSDEEGEFSDVLSDEDFDQPKAKGRGKAGGGARGGKGSKKGAASAGVEDIVIKAKDEGARARSGSAPLGQCSVKGKGAATRKAGQQASAQDEMEVDVVGASSPAQAGEGSQAAKEELPPQPTSATKPQKKKLPTIKKNKSLQPSGTGPPAAAKAGTSAVNSAADAVVKSVLGDIKPVAGAGARKPAAMMGVADLDLSDQSLYNELFKGGGAGGSRRAKDEERRKELENMKKEWKAKREQEQLQTPLFDLQAQAEKTSRFEEKLRANRSSALYPNFLAGKWRELWEHDRRQAAAQNGPPPQPPPPHTNGQVMTNGR